MSKAFENEAEIRTKAHLSPEDMQTVIDYCNMTRLCWQVNSTHSVTVRGHKASVEWFKRNMGSLMP